MSEHKHLRWVSGPVASAVVADDPFWSAVRRRDPEIAIALLPAEGAAPAQSGPDEHPKRLDEPDGYAARVLDEVTAAWSSYVDAEPARADGRWLPGPVSGTVRREVTLSHDDVDETVGARALQLAAEALRSDGWHVLVPEAGLPRVLAGRGSRGRAEVHLVRVPDRRRLVLRVRTEPLLVDEETARRLVVAP